MTDSDEAALGAPAKRGENTPVPKDVQTKRFAKPEAARPVDELIPMSYVEQRAEERQSQPAQHLYYLPDDEDTGADAVANPVGGSGGGVPASQGPVQNPLAQNPALYGMPPYAPYYGAQPVPQLPAPYAPMPGMTPGAHPLQMYQLAPEHGYAPQFNPYGYPHQYYGQPYQVPAGYSMPQQMPLYGVSGGTGIFGPPREVWSKKRKRVALWSSFIQQTLAAIALHVLVFGALFLLVASTSWNDFAEDGMVDGPASFTGFMVWLSHPSRVWISVVLLLIVTSTVFAFAYWIGSYMQKSAGIRQGRASAFWLAGVSGGGITFFAWIIVYFIVGFIVLIIFMVDGQGFAGVWGAAFFMMALASVVHGFYSMAFGRMFLHRARPAIDFQQLAAEAEARARAEDEARMARDPHDF